MSSPSSPSSSSTFSPPKSVLIVGSGVFGLSTALSLATRACFNSTTVTILDRSTFPSPDGSSIDTSRIVRPDYADPAYASLANKAQSIWRQQGTHQLGGQGRYSESGLVLVANKGSKGEPYVRSSFQNILFLNKGTPEEGSVKELSSTESIEKAFGTGGGSGDWGYLNTRSGWADAEACMVWLREQVAETGRVGFLTGEVTTLIYSSPSAIQGVKLKDGSILKADLTILATGAWTPSLVDLRGRCQSTGQVLSYLPITDEEQERFGKMPVLLSMSTGMFIIPPANNLLKVARHGYGYSNPVQISHPMSPSQEFTVSRPYTTTDNAELRIPKEGEEACRQALREMIPSLADRPFTKTRICWYTDTPKGDFLISYHPSFSNLFLATGDSGHGFKFLPVIGDKIVDCIEGNCPPDFKDKWSWPNESVDNVVTEDGSRGGPPDMILQEEMRGSRAHHD